MTKEENNKTVVGRSFTEFWGKKINLAVVDEILATNMLLEYSLHAPRRGHADIKAFMTDFRAAFPDLNSGHGRSDCRRRLRRRASPPNATRAPEGCGLASLSVGVQG